MAGIHTGTLGWVYIGLTTAWTSILVGGMVFLYHHRQLPFLRVRRLPLVFIAILLLHMYEAAAMAAWTYGPLMPCDAQFWIMSIYLPFGMALLQAASSQFLHVATKQRKYTHFESLDSQNLPETALQAAPSLGWWSRTTGKIRRTDSVTRILIYIGLGMVIELALTFFVYFGSDTFHPGYGIFHAQIPVTEDRMARCLVGWEWWLSIIWQFFWAWVYAPFMLWKTRKIYDTSGWRFQTILCCIAGLPASPLWLAGLYIPQMAPVNAILVPPQWFAVSIFFIEVFTILSPCWQVIKTHSLKRETMAAIASWEQRNKAAIEGTANPSTNTSISSGKTLGTSLAARSQTSKSSLGSRRSDMFTMIALQNSLESNPTPLLEFAALKDFSGENVSFLLQVSHWKGNWTVLKDNPQLMHEQFIRAVRIYSRFISLKFSEFPINICSRHAKDMFQAFDECAQNINKRGKHCDQVAPFDTDFPTTLMTDLRLDSDKDHCLETTLGAANLKSVTDMAQLERYGSLNCPIPNSFGPEIFDAAEEEIKYLVLTNTWPKFVHAGLRNASQEENNGLTRSIVIGKLFCGWGDMA